MFKNRQYMIFKILITVCVLVLALPMATAQSGPTEDPIPIISMGSGRAMVVRLDFLTDDVVTVSTEVVLVPPPAFVGAPPQLRLMVTDALGAEIQGFNHWDPRLGSIHDNGNHYHEEFEMASGRFVIPFTILASELAVTDLVAGNIVLTVVDLEPAIQLFCDENPSDPDCIFDVGITKDGPLTPVAAGTNFDYTITVENFGENPALGILFIDTLPAGVSFVGSNLESECAEAPAGTISCPLDSIPGGTSVVFTVTVTVAADLVYNNGGPLSIINNVEADPTVGTDTNPVNNTDDESTDIVAVADLAIMDLFFTDVPEDLLAGEEYIITAHTVITNGGPSAPMDVTVDATASAAPVGEAEVTPTMITMNEIALALNELRPLSNDYTISCSAGLFKTFSFAYNISPTNVADTDPNPLNNDVADDILLDCVIPVDIDVRPPGNEQNPVNLGSNGVLRVGIMSNPIYNLQATDIDPATISLDGATIRYKGNGEPMLQQQDLNSDGWMDIIAFVEINELQLDSSAVETQLDAKTYGGISVRGWDNIRIVPGK